MRTFVLSAICLMGLGLVVAAQPADPLAADPLAADPPAADTPATERESTPAEKPVDDPAIDPAEVPVEESSEEPAVNPSGIGDMIEVRMVGTLKSGVVAIGGETTGFNIVSGGYTWEVDFSQRPRLAKRAASMGNTKVILEGMLERREGVETGARDVVVATALRPATRPTALDDRQRQILRNKLLEQKRQAIKNSNSPSLPALKRTLDSQSEPPRSKSPFEN